MTRVACLKTNLKKLGVAIIGVMICATGCLAQALERTVRHEYPRSSELLKAEYNGNYERVAIKRDIFLVGSRVIINEPLNSNGGNVFVVTNELVINAPIDTRIQFSMTSDYWISKPKGSGSGDLSDTAVDSPRAKRAFDELYLWRESYDGKQRRYVFAPTSAPGPKKPTRLFQLPSAQVPLSPDTLHGRNPEWFRVMPANGGDAPDNFINWTNVRSGNIKIFAAKVSLCEECIKALSIGSTLSRITRPADGDPFDQERAIFLHAGGLKGGRGAAGSLPLYAPKSRLAGTFGGYSGLPGRGGDAGNVDIIFVNQDRTDAEEAQRATIRAATNIEGGAPAHIHRQRTPPFSALAASGSRSAFFANAEAIPNHEKLFGAEGSITIRDANSDEALNEIATLLALADLTPDYDIGQILDGAREAATQTSLSPSDVLRPLLTIELQRLQLDLVNSVVPSLRNETPRIHFGPFFKTLSCKSDSYFGLKRIDREYLRRICQFEEVQGSDALRGYFYRVEGLFRTVPRDVNVGLRHAETVNQLEELQKLSTVLIDEISKTRLMLYQQISGETKGRMVSNLRELEKRNASILAAIKKAAAANNDKDFFTEVVGPATSMVQDFSEAFIAAYSEQWVVAAMKFDSGWKKLSTLIVCCKFRRHDNTPMLDQEIAQMRAAIVAFADLVRTNREAMILGQRRNLRRFMELREDIERRAREQRFRFEDIIRAVIQDYLQSPANEWDRLETNLNIIRSSLESDRNVYTQLDVGVTRDQCQVQQQPVPLSRFESVIGCAELEGQNLPYAYISKLDRAKDFPLIVVGKSSPFVIVPFQHAFRRRDIEMKVLPDGWRIGW